jgi:hypothetical protein
MQGGVEMINAPDLQVWFDAQTNMGPGYVVAYVRAAQAARIEYDFKVITAGGGGTSRVEQSGDASLVAGEAKALSSVRTLQQTGGTCQIDLVLHEGARQLGEYTYDCSVKK